MLEWSQLLGGAFLLFLGAEWFVGGASSLALLLRVPQLTIGLTVVAYGTSAPELFVSVQAAADGRGAVALGNVIGSNVANVGLILGSAILLSPPLVDAGLGRRELPVMVLSALALPLLLLDGVVGTVDGVVLVLCAVAYTVTMVRVARREGLGPDRVNLAVTEAAADTAGAPARRGPLWAVGAAVGGLALLLVGSRLFVDGAVTVAQGFGMSERLVGLTIVAVGTSLPELVTSVIAAKRGHGGIALGNVVGSNVFNVLLCLGCAAMAGEIAAPLRGMAVDIGALFGATLLAAIAIRRARRLRRIEGLLMVCAYVAFTAWVVARG
jgi:cation:H+ antiporter